MNRIFYLFAPLVLALASISATAGDTESGRDRYTMSPVDGGQLRLDKETGAVAFCARRDGAWTCESVNDTSKAANDRMAQLEAENKALKDRVAELEAKAGSEAPESGPPGGKIQIPTEEEIDKALDYAEKLFKKFRDRLQKVEPPKDSAPGDGGRL